MGSTSETVCVTGAAGFIGSWLVTRLLEHNYTVRDSELPCAIQYEVIKPTINGMLSIMKACVNAKTVRKLVFTSSASAVRFGEHEKPAYDENCWTDVEFCRNKRCLDGQGSCCHALVMIEHVIQFTCPSKFTLTCSIAGNEAHYSTLKQTQFVHLDDLCNAQIFLYEHPKAEGRCICSGCDATIHDVAKLLREKFPEYNVPTKFKDVDENLEIISFSSKKIKELGFEFKYNLEDMYVGAVETCRGKGLLPPAAEKRVNGTGLLPPAAEKRVNCTS